jgi:hypothetical protein
MKANSVFSRSATLARFQTRAERWRRLHGRQTDLVKSQKSGQIWVRTGVYLGHVGRNNPIGDRGESMLLGFEGTVGGADDYLKAAGTAMGHSLNSPAARIAGQVAGPVMQLAAGVGMLAMNSKSIGKNLNAMTSVIQQRAMLNDFGFIGQMFRNYQGKKQYIEGPTTLGAENPELIKAGVNYVFGNCGENEELIVAGYSRGGLNAINACNLLAGTGRIINLLVLFDPVDRDLNFGGCNISAAVRNCILVQRQGNTLTWRPYQRSISIVGRTISFPDVHLTNSRWYFGRMVSDEDRKSLTSGHLEHAQYDATHAAFGGLPWTGDFPGYLNERQDRALAASIAESVNKACLKLSNGAFNPKLSLLYSGSNGTG